MLKRSITIAKKHDTSVSLEEEFWQELKIIAKSKNLSINQLITEIDETNDGNLSSAIRVYILQSIKNT